MQVKQFRNLVLTMANLIFEHNILRAAAGLSYFLTLSFFPLLICLYNMLGSLFPSMEQLRFFLNGLLPHKTTSTILDFLRYVSLNTDTTMLVVALFVLVTSSSAAFRTIGNVTGEMRGKERYSGFFGFLFSVFFSLLFLAAVYLSVILIVTGKWFLDFLDRHLMFINVSDAWSWARFFLLFLLLYVILALLYRVTAPREKGVRILPGALFGAMALVTVSLLFSMFIGTSISYPLVYGSLASIIVMMFWLYVCGIVVFMGNALNVALEKGSV